MGQPSSEWQKRQKSSYQFFEKIQKEENKGLLWALFITLAFCLFVFLFGGNFVGFTFKDYPDAPPPPPIGRFALYEAILGYQKKYSSWPTSKEQLQTYLDQNKMVVTVHPFTTLELKPQKDGSLWVEYQLRGADGPESGRFSIIKP